jgi:superoxide dismutase, Cu-Zn family
MKDIDVLKKRTLVIHAGGDNHSDLPASLGGNKGRAARGEME